MNFRLWEYTPCSNCTNCTNCSLHLRVKKLTKNRKTLRSWHITILIRVQIWYGYLSIVHMIFTLKGVIPIFRTHRLYRLVNYTVECLKEHIRNVSHNKFRSKGLSWHITLFRAPPGLVLYWFIILVSILNFIVYFSNEKRSLMTLYNIHGTQSLV